MKGPKTVYRCTECDYQSPKWLGRCPECQSWNTFVEETFQAPAESLASRLSDLPAEKAKKISQVTGSDGERRLTNLSELDRVLGGGLVHGCVVLLAGEPGIGKSTLLMQLSGRMARDYSVLYVSGEESAAQLKMRAERLRCNQTDFLLLTETRLETILRETEETKPDVLIIDSIQTLSSESSPSSPGSIAQVRECTSQILSLAKHKGISVIIVGHVNKEGGIAGPKVLEHMVDAVLSFEGDRTQAHRIIRAVKNRYGSTNEIGVFEMTETGLEMIENPSAMLLSGRPKDVSGSCAVCVLEGTRPIIAEIQALVTPTVFPSPRRTASGVDYNRLVLLLAVLEKRLGLRFSTCDVYINVVGGLKVDEPGVDAAIALALISSLRDLPVPMDLIAMGEIGLAGEIRSVSSIEQRVKEASRLGFNRIALPASTGKKKISSSSDLIPIRSIYDMLALLS